jgi:hypothetical protein
MPASTMVDLALCWFCAIWLTPYWWSHCVCLFMLTDPRFTLGVVGSLGDRISVPEESWMLCSRRWGIFLTHFKYASSISDLSPFWGFTFATVLDQCCTYQLVTLLHGVHLLEYYQQLNKISTVDLFFKFWIFNNCRWFILGLELMHMVFSFPTDCLLQGWWLFLLRWWFRESYPTIAIIRWLVFESSRR